MFETRSYYDAVFGYVCCPLDLAMLEEAIAGPMVTEVLCASIGARSGREQHGIMFYQHPV